MKARIKFRKYGALRFIGHLDVMRFFQKVMRRAEIPIAFTSGYSPHMIMSFASPLGIGLTSDGEYFDIELSGPIFGEEAVRRMNAVSVDGIEVVSFRQIPEEKKMTGMAIVAAADYLVRGEFFRDFVEKISDSVFSCEIYSKKITAFLEQAEIRVLKQTKRSEKEVDIRPLIYQMETRKEGIFMRLAAGSVQNLKPELVMSAFFAFIGKSEEVPPCFLHRLDMYADLASDAEKEAGKHQFVTLESLGWESGEENA